MTSSRTPQRIIEASAHEGPNASRIMPSSGTGGMGWEALQAGAALHSPHAHERRWS